MCWFLLRRKCVCNYHMKRRLVRFDLIAATAHERAARAAALIAERRSRPPRKRARGEEHQLHERTGRTHTHPNSGRRIRSKRLRSRPESESEASAEPVRKCTKETSFRVVRGGGRRLQPRRGRSCGPNFGPRARLRRRRLIVR